MKCRIKASRGEVIVSGMKLTELPVVCEETPEILYYIAMGWVQRVEVDLDAAPAPVVDPEPAATARVIRRRRG